MARPRAVVASVGVGVVLLCLAHCSRATTEVAEIDPVVCRGTPGTRFFVYLMVTGTGLDVFIDVVEHMFDLRELIIDLAVSNKYRYIRANRSQVCCVGKARRESTSPSLVVYCPCFHMSKYNNQHGNFFKFYVLYLTTNMVIVFII